MDEKKHVPRREEKDRLPVIDDEVVKDRGENTG
jgi:hypothetical protein